LNTIHNVRGNSSYAETHHQPIKGAPPTKGQHISFLLACFGSFLVTAPSKNGSADFDDLNVKNAVSRKEVPFRDPNLTKNFQGVQFPEKPLKVGPGVGISGLNKTMYNFSTVHPISAQSSSVGAAWRKTSEIFNGTTKMLV
jgi:hypothetical protein